MKSTLILLVALVAVVGYIYFVDQKKPVGEAAAKEKAFGELKADDIESIEIVPAGGEPAHLEKKNGKWIVSSNVSGSDSDADTSEVTSITTSLASVEVQRVVDDNASDMKPYGLDPPRVQVTFTPKGGKPRTLLLGEKTPTGGDLYARLPDSKRVFLVSSYLDTTFNRDPFALRDKAVLKFDREKVDGLELQSGNTDLQFTKNGMEWSIVKPVAVRADYGAVEGALERLATVQMQSIAAADLPKLADFGLDKPESTISVGLGGSRATLLLGKTENGTIYAKDTSRPMVFTVAPTVKTDLFKDVAEYRRKDLFDARAFTATKATFTRGAETITLEKTKDPAGKNGDGKETWKNGAGKTVDAAKADDLVSKVTALRAQSFSSAVDPSLKSPALTVTLQFDPGKNETVTFARSGTNVVAERSGEPGSAQIEAAAFDEVMKAVDAVK